MTCLPSYSILIFFFKEKKKKIISLSNEFHFILLTWLTWCGEKKCSPTKTRNYIWKFFIKKKKNRVPQWRQGRAILRVSLARIWVEEGDFHGMLETHGYNSSLKTSLQGKGAQKLINTWLNLHLIHMEHYDHKIQPRFAADNYSGSL